MKKPNKIWRFESVQQLLDLNTTKCEKTACILWNGHLSASGYAMTSFQSKRYRVHRLVWEHFNGPIPINLNVCHKCDVRNCVNVNHLFLGTQKQNMEDCRDKKRHRGMKNTHCQYGHELSGDNLVLRKRRGGNPFRACHTCIRFFENKRRKDQMLWMQKKLKGE